MRVLKHLGVEVIKETLPSASVEDEYDYGENRKKRKKEKRSTRILRQKKLPF